MNLKIIAICFILYSVQTIQGGSFKYALLLKQPLQIQELIQSINMELRSLDTQFELEELKLKTAMTTAKLNSKLQIKELQNVAKMTEDATCALEARIASKDIKNQLDNLKLCSGKDDAKLVKNNIREYFKSLSMQCWTVTDFCSLLKDTVAEIDACILERVDDIKEQVNEVRDVVSGGLEQLTEMSTSCINEVVDDLNKNILNITQTLYLCLNPIVPTEPSLNQNEESNHKPLGEELKQSEEGVTENKPENIITESSSQEHKTSAELHFEESEQEASKENEVLKQSEEGENELEHQTEVLKENATTTENNISQHDESSVKGEEQEDEVENQSGGEETMVTQNGNTNEPEQQTVNNQNENITIPRSEEENLEEDNTSGHPVVNTPVQQQTIPV